MINMNWLTREQEIAILMEDHCTLAEAKRFVDTNNATIFTASKLLEEVKYWKLDEEDPETYEAMYLNMIEKKEPLNDWSVVDYDNETYYIAYCL